ARKGGETERVTKKRPFPGALAFVSFLRKRKLLFLFFTGGRRFLRFGLCLCGVSALGFGGLLHGLGVGLAGSHARLIGGGGLVGGLLVLLGVLRHVHGDLDRELLAQFLGQDGDAQARGSDSGHCAQQLE